MYRVKLYTVNKNKTHGKAHYKQANSLAECDNYIRKHLTDDSQWKSAQIQIWNPDKGWQLYEEFGDEPESPDILVDDSEVTNEPIDISEYDISEEPDYPNDDWPDDDDGYSDAEADADTLRSAGWGTDEEYGSFSYPDDYPY